MVRADLLIGVALLYLAAINGVTWLAFATDKAAACDGRRRISEATLLGLALAGGTPAAYFARHTLRHKTRKQPFSFNLHMTVAMQIAALLFGAVLYLDVI
jgi:uncharacterized membrane protein YsdA (DUF1294 family)